jgi:hypothetical protein
MSVFDQSLQKGTTHAAIPKGMASVKLNSSFKVAAPFFEAYRCHRISSDAVPELAST